MATATQAAPSTAPMVESQRLMAQTDIGTAWESHKQNGLAFGRQCYEWGEKFKAQGSRSGSTFQNVLNSLDIPRHIADFWSMKYKASIGEGIPCPSCIETFPSKTQLKRHQQKAHPETFQPAPPKKPAASAPIPAEPSETQPTAAPAVVITDDVNFPHNNQPSSAQDTATDEAGWTRDDEKRKHRDGAHDFEELRALSLEALKIGFKQLWETKTDKHSALSSAKSWAVATLESA